MRDDDWLFEKKLDLERITKLYREATIGPWTWRHPSHLCNKHIDEGIVLDVYEEEGQKVVWCNEANGKFIAASIELIPRLVGRVRELEAEVAKLKLRSYLLKSTIEGK